MVKILIATIQMNLVLLGLGTNSPELSLLKFLPLTYHLQPFLGRHLGFHIFFHHSLFEGHTLFLQFGCFGLDFTSFCICIGQIWDFFNLCFFSLPQEEEKMKQILNTLNISDFISKCTNYNIIN